MSTSAILVSHYITAAILLLRIALSVLFRPKRTSWPFFTTGVIYSIFGIMACITSIDYWNSNAEGSNEAAMEPSVWHLVSHLGSTLSAPILLFHIHAGLWILEQNRKPNQVRWGLLVVLGMGQVGLGIALWLTMSLLVSVDEDGVHVNKDGLTLFKTIFIVFGSLVLIHTAILIFKSIHRTLRPLYEKRPSNLHVPNTAAEHIASLPRPLPRNPAERRRDKLILGLRIVPFMATLLFSMVHLIVCMITVVDIEKSGKPTILMIAGVYTPWTGWARMVTAIGILGMLVAAWRRWD